MVATRPPVGFLEIHPENFLANPHAMELLIELSRHYPISVHSVGVSVGSATGLDCAHLRRVCALVDRINPFLISGHLAWSTHQEEFLNDLLPLPFNDEALQLVSARIHEVQDALGRPYLLENPSSYVSFCASTMTEAEFLARPAACARTPRTRSRRCQGNRPAAADLNHASNNRASHLTRRASYWLVTPSSDWTATTSLV
jgi:uncharacterized protein (UPF0276 family)